MSSSARSAPLIAAWLVCAVALAGPSSAQVDLIHLGTYATGLFDQGASEISAYDAASRRLFTVNAAQQRIDIIDISDPAAPALAGSIDVTPWGAAANSIDCHDGILAAAIENVNRQADGRVVFFDASGQYLADYPAGALPDMLSFTPDGGKVLVANEGEPNNAYTVDPEGSITVVDLAGGVANASVTQVGFSAYNGAVLDPSIRIFGPNATVAQDLEPEYIAVSPDSRTAWVSLQEANALAVLDLDQNAVAALVGLDFKDHLRPGNGLDASDQSGSIQISSWPVFGMYQPDGLDAYEAGGEVWIVAANEGDARAYGGFNEERRVNQLDLDNAAFPNEAMLKQNTNLGRLRVTGATGDPDHDNDFDALYAFGARSLSIRDSSGALVWDSGDELEQITAAAYPTEFNSNNVANQSFKTRSDDKGPEPEGVDVATLQGRTYAFVGLERIGGVVVYDVTDPLSPQFAVYRNHRDFSGNPAGGTALDLGPEGVLVIPAAESPNGFDLLVVSNEISGSTSIFRIELPAAGIESPAGPDGIDGGESGDDGPGSGDLGRVTCGPNPTTGRASVRFSLRRECDVELTVHDVRGRQVSIRACGTKAAGFHAEEVPLAGKDGKAADAGIYFVRVRAGRDTAVRKLVLP